MKNRIICPALFTLAACAPTVQSVPIFPPAQDVEAATEAKPVPPLDIVTSARAAAEYNAAIEVHAMRIRAAAIRVCRWLNGRGGNYNCGEGD